VECNSIGGYGTVGGFTAPYGSIGNYQANNLSVANVAVGASAGAGGGFFRYQCRNYAVGGPFQSLVVNLPGITVEVDWAGKIVVGSATWGPTYLEPFDV
jgi:hypothetical protein